MKVKYFAAYLMNIPVANIILAAESNSYSKLDDMPFTEDAVGGKRCHYSTYIVPNEFNPGDQYEALANAEGLLASVGSFRPLIIYAWADRITHLLAIDFNTKTVEFNRRHFDIIRQLNENYSDDIFLQRFHYVCKLHGRAFSGDLTAQERDTPNIVTLVRDLMKANNGRLKRDYLPVAEWREFDSVQFQNECAVGMPYAVTLFQYAPAPANSTGYYWDDDKQWLKIVDGLKNNKIAVATANLEDDLEMAKLTVYIKSTGLNFGIFDKSNIPKISTHLMPADVLLYSEQVACQFKNKWKKTDVSLCANEE